ncbi:PAS domain-containing sensor histidine kinase [Alkaliphilus transvaalensis]|uniref:PAS domain-containing sensor histidine kinase n=1 Tax=Alkaliphilus transvaalensis TaxID=114628 RepID=UPI0004795EBC|nr:PAS domain-containing sensor histidine kinase [Alkaliphilus transvaalensis]
MGVFSNTEVEKVDLTKRYNLVQTIGIYALLSIVWIIFSDKLIDLIVKNNTQAIILQITKGSVFVIISALLMYHLISKNIETINVLQYQVDSYEEQYKFVINNTTDGLWDWDITNNKVVLPVKWKEKLGYNSHELPNTVKGWENVIHPEDRKWVKNTITSYINGKIPEYNVEYRVVMKTGDIMWVQDCGKAIWDQKGKPIRISGTHTDITNRKMAEEALLYTIEENNVLLAKSQEHERLQAEFFSNISHEFKTPLNVILGTIQLIDCYKQDDLNELDFNQVVKWIPMMKQNCFRLLRLINNLLDISKLDADALNIKYKNYNIIYIIEEITQSIAVLAQNKGISITFDTDVEEKIMACDINIIERIILNLLSNAIKYTESGKHVYVTIFDQDDHILISIKDTGIGIPQDKLDTIFDRFRQIDASLHRKVEGTGIGLSLVKSLIDKLNGQIWVQSKKGIGSEFLIKLPVIVLEEESIELDSHDYTKNLVEKINIELSDIYSL